MKKSKKVLLGLGILITIIFPVLNLHYIVKITTIAREIKVIKRENSDQEKIIAIKKLKLESKIDLSSIERRARKELKMDIAKDIEYIKIKENIADTF